MGTFLKSLAAGIAVALGGVVFAGLWGEFFNGFSKENSTILGMQVFLCVVLIVCTGILVAELRKRK